MNYNFIIIRTKKGRKYARKILSSVNWIGQHKYPDSFFNILDFTIEEFLVLPNHDFKQVYGVNNTIIHARCANPRTEWTEKLRELEEDGYKVVNSVDCIELTSNKLACSLHLQGKVNHPKSLEWKKNWSYEEKVDFINMAFHKFDMPKFFVAKPYTSLEQGANVKKLSFLEGNNNDVITSIDVIPGNKIVIQEYVDYTALHRVIVIGGKALPYTFIDKPEWHPDNWKVSCCLNRTTMRINENANKELLKLAEQTQKEVGGVINFIDIFEYGFPDERPEWPMYTNAEINTACSLNIHEELAKKAGRKDWNIHYRIAKQLVKELIDG